MATFRSTKSNPATPAAFKPARPLSHPANGVPVQRSRMPTDQQERLDATRARLRKKLNEKGSLPKPAATSPVLPVAPAVTAPPSVPVHGSPKNPKAMAPTGSLPATKGKKVPGTSSPVIKLSTPPSELVDIARKAGHEQQGADWAKYEKSVLKRIPAYSNLNEDARTALYNAYREGSVSTTTSLPTFHPSSYVPGPPRRPQLTAEESAEREQAASAAFLLMVEKVKTRLVTLRAGRSGTVCVIIDRYGNEVCHGYSGGVQEEKMTNAHEVSGKRFVHNPSHESGYGSACAEIHALAKWHQSGKGRAPRFSLARDASGLKSACGTCRGVLKEHGIVDLMLEIE